MRKTKASPDAKYTFHAFQFYIHQAGIYKLKSPFIVSTIVGNFLHILELYPSIGLDEYYITNTPVSAYVQPTHLWISHSSAGDGQ